MVWRDVANASVTIVQPGGQLAGITAVDTALCNTINSYIRGGSRRRSFVGGGTLLAPTSPGELLVVDMVGASGSGWTGSAVFMMDGMWRRVGVK